MAWDDAPPTKSELKQSSNWDASPPSSDELKTIGAGPKDDVSVPETALEQFAKPITYGYLPKLQAAAEPITDRIYKGLGLAGSDKNTPVAPWKQAVFSGPEYDKAKQENQDRQQKEVQDNPVTSVASGLGGAITGGIATGGLLKAGVAAAAPGVSDSLQSLQQAKGLLPAAGRIGLAGATGAAQGLAYDPGQTQDGQSDLDARLSQAKLGGLLGSGFQAAGEVGRGVADTFKDTARKYAIKTAGPAAGDVQKLIKTGQLDKVGDFMLDNKIPSSDIQDVLDKTQNLKDQAGKTIGNIYNQVLDKKTDQSFLDSLTPELADKLQNGGFKPVTDGNALKNQLEQQMTGKAKGGQAFKQVSSIIDDFAKKGDGITIQDANDMKGQLDHLINYDKDIRDNTLAQQGLKTVRDFINNKTQDEVKTLGQVLDSDSYDALKKANATYGNAARVQGIAQGALGREAARNILSPSEKGALGLGVVTGLMSPGDEHSKIPGGRVGHALAYGAGGLLASKLGNNFNDATRAGIYNGLSKMGPNLSPLTSSSLAGQLGGNLMNQKRGLLRGQQ
jgi:hypothetical protein